MTNFTVVDTDILIDAMRAIDKAVSYLRRLEHDSAVALSAITQMELIVGCRSKNELSAVNKFLNRFLVLSVNEEISNNAVELLNTYRLSHNLFMADALIAATALYFDAPLASKNQKDFRFIPNLNLLAYS